MSVALSILMITALPQAPAFARDVAPVLTVEQATSLLPSSRGKIVRVRGRVVKSCQPRSCSLQSTTSQAALSLARVMEVERSLVARAGSIVTVTARFGRPAVFSNGEWITVQTDRADELIPIAVED